MWIKLGNLAQKNKMIIFVANILQIILEKEIKVKQMWKYLLMLLFCTYIHVTPSFGMHEERIICTFPRCTQSFTTILMMNAHIKMHKECGGTLLKCKNTECKDFFYSTEQRKNHYLAAHPEIAAALAVKKIRKPSIRKAKKKKKKPTKVPVIAIMSALSRAPSATVIIENQINSSPVTAPNSMPFVPAGIIATPPNSKALPASNAIVQATPVILSVAHQAALSLVSLEKKRLSSYKSFCDLESAISPSRQEITESISALPLVSPRKKKISEGSVYKRHLPLKEYECCKQFAYQHSSKYKLHVLQEHPELFLTIHDPECSVCARY